MTRKGETPAQADGTWRKNGMRVRSAIEKGKREYNENIDFI